MTLQQSTQTLARADFTPFDLRNAMGRYASGITIVSGLHDDAPVGMTCQSFFSQSLNPPLIAFSVMETSTTYPRLRASGGFCVNVLSATQQPVSAQFGRSGVDKWAGIDWSPAASGNPVIDGALLWVDCELDDEFVAGDHTIVIGRVLQFGTAEHDDEDALLFFKGGYRSLGAPHVA